MSFRDFPGQQRGIQLLQRSLEHGRLAHAYLFTGQDISELENIARALAQTLNCLQPVRARNGAAVDCCGTCLNCRKIADGNHADVHWVRPESKTRVIKVEQMRELMAEINLKPTEAQYKIAIIAGADRLHVNAANAFLKTLEEPPPKSILILLTTEPERVLETLVSRCLRLGFAGEGRRRLSAEESGWLEQFSDMAAGGQKTLLGRYRLLDVLLQRLGRLKSDIEQTLGARSPLQQYEDAEKELRERWEEELSAAIEAEYRRQRAELLVLVQQWLRDVWVQAHHSDGNLLNFPQLGATALVARKISAADALKNLQVMEDTLRLLYTNVQEALALEVGLLKLRL